jgi:hypothetical protein
VVGTYHLSIPFAREIVQHHLNVGISHVYLSYTGDMVHRNVLEVNRGGIMQQLRELEFMLADFIREGKVCD